MQRLSRILAGALVASSAVFAAEARRSAAVDREGLKKIAGAPRREPTPPISGRRPDLSLPPRAAGPQIRRFTPRRP